MTAIKASTADPKRAYYKTIRSRDDLAGLLAEAGVSGDRFLIKPNWFDPRPGSYTDPAILDLVLSVLPGKKTVIEGHSHARNDLSMKITPENQDAQRDWIRRQERDYLTRLGLYDVMARHGVEYINITEEVWAGRTAPADAVRGLVEEKYGRVGHPELYASVPQKLYDLRSHTLIDLARVKMTSPSTRDFSLTMKNLFGLVPPPSRMGYHDELPRSIVDIAMVYSTLFDVVGLCEGIHHSVVFWEGGRFATPWSHFDVIKNLGLAVCGRHLPTVDTYVGRLFGQDLTERAVVKLGRDVFGRVRPEDVAAAPLLVDVAGDFVPALEAAGKIVTEWSNPAPR
ncbi:MAG: DUF362 domain-containing protein [Bacillota bacterium]